MKFKFLFAITILQVVISSSLFGQNLVPNNGFEILKKKPCSAVINSTDNISNYVADWSAPTAGTSDIQLERGVADSCAINLQRYGLTVHSGNVCAGIFTLGNSPRLSALSGILPYREYLQVKLLKKLEVGRIYYVEFYVSPFNAGENSIASLYSNNIGCFFSKDSIYRKSGVSNEFGELPYTPQINENRVLDKPGQWYKISGCFEAIEEASFITIGNFFNDESTSYSEIDKRGRGAYYLIDDILVEQTDNSYLPKLTLRDITLCPNQTISIKLDNNPEVVYIWQDKTNASNYSVKEAGLYSVTAISGKCTLSREFMVNAEPLLKLPKDTTLCQATIFTIEPYDFQAAVQWNDGSQKESLSVSMSGLYWVTTNAHSCVQTDSIRIDFVDCPDNIPNVFTPNKDGVNDTFYINNLSLSTWRLEITNRWGKTVYKTEDYKNDWRGDDLPTGTYYYSLSSTILKKDIKGWVQLLR